MAEQPAILAQNLTRRFGDFVAVDHLNFEVHRGEIFGFLGPNGAGKTTTIRMILGLLRPSEGTIEVLGMQMNSSTAQIRPRLGYMSQRFSLYNDLTVLQNLQFYGKSYGLGNTQLQHRIQEALHMAALEGREHTRTRELSGGWRQRLALGAAILHRPEVLFLDEPTASVDPLSRRAFWELLYYLTTQGITVFVTTHYMDEAEHCHRLAFIQKGKIIAYGTPYEIKHTKMSNQVLEIASSNAVAAVKALRLAQQAGRLPLEEIELYGSLVHVIASDISQYQPAIKTELSQAGVEVSSMSILEPSLEDVFIACMR